MNHRKVYYLLKLSFLIATIAACTFVSSYSTYQGLLAVLNDGFAKSLAICSGLILIMMPFAMFRLLERTRFIPFRLAYVIVIPLGIFALSTVWSIVGLAKDEIFMHLVQENNAEFVDSYYPSEITSKIERVDLLLGNIEAFASRGAKNAMSGIYSGIPGHGDISRTMGLLADKAKTTKGQMDLLEVRVRDDLSAISDLVNTMQTLNRWDDKDQYLSVIREVNRKIKGLEDVGIDVMVSEAKTSVDSAADNLKTIQEENIKKLSSRGVIDSEVNTLKAYSFEIDKLSENLQVSFPLVDVSRMDTPIVLLAFRNMMKIFNWWALCIGLDFAPFPLIYLLGALRDPFEYD